MPTDWRGEGTTRQVSARELSVPRHTLIYSQQCESWFERLAMVVSDIDSGLQDEAAPIQDTADQLTPNTDVVSLAEKHAAMFSSPVIEVMNSSAFAKQFDGMTKSFKIHEVFRDFFNGLPSQVVGLGFKGFADELTKSWQSDLFKASGIGLAQSLLTDSGIGMASNFLKDSGVGFAQNSFKHLPVGLQKRFFQDSAVGFSPGFFGAEMKRLMEPITTPLASGLAAGLTDWTSDPRVALSTGVGPRHDTTTVDRSVDAWLYERRADFRQKYRSMWDALERSLDPVLHSSTSAVELLMHLCGVCGASDSDVRAWAKSEPQFADEAIDKSQGFERVTWAGRARLAAIRAGFDDVGQALVVSLADSARVLQRMKHSAHRYDVSDVEPHLVSVDELLSMLAWRL